MLAAIYSGPGGPDVITFGEVPKPEVRPGHIRVRVHAAGFTPRAIRGVRRSLIVNYVKPEWRARHELAFPDQVVTGVL